MSRYTAYAYEDNDTNIADSADYDDKNEAIKFAKFRNWDEVVDNKTSEIIWSR